MYFDSNQLPFNLEAFEDKDIAHLIENINEKQQNITDQRLAQAIKEQVIKNPKKFICYYKEFLNLPPIFPYEINQGLIKAARDNVIFDIEIIIDAIKDFLLQEKHPGPREDDGVDHVLVITSFERLLEDDLKKGAESKLINESLKNKTFSIIEYFINNKFESLEKEEEAGRDPLTISLNTIRGMGIHLLMRYCIWYHYKINNAEIPERAKDLLAILLDYNKEKSITLRSVIGLFIGNLYAIDSKWFKDNIPYLFPPSIEYNDHWLAIWESYVIYTGFYEKIFVLLRDQYEAAVEKVKIPENEKKFGIEVGVHLVLALVTDNIKEIPGSLIEKYYSKVSLDTKESVILQLGKALQISQPLETDKDEDNKIISKFHKFWEWRLDYIEENPDERSSELKWIENYWSHLPVTKKNLELYYRSLKLNHGFVIHPDFVVNKLYEYIDAEPETVLDISKLIIKNDTYPITKKLAINAISSLLDKIESRYLNQFTDIIEEIRKLLND